MRSRVKDRVENARRRDPQFNVSPFNLWIFAEEAIQALASVNVAGGLHKRRQYRLEFIYLRR